MEVYVLLEHWGASLKTANKTSDSRRQSCTTSANTAKHTLQYAVGNIIAKCRHRASGKVDTIEVWMANMVSPNGLPELRESCINNGK